MKKFLAIILSTLLAFAGTILPVSAETRDAANLNEALNYPGDNLEFVSEGDYPWAVEGDHAKSTNQGVDSSYNEDYTEEIPSLSTVMLTAETNEGDVIAFEYAVSSEERMDLFKFYIDGELIQRWSGEVDWSGMSIELSAGTHTFEWTYYKDYVASDGEDTAWLDNVHVGAPLPVNGIEVTSNVSVPAQRKAQLEWMLTPLNAHNTNIIFSSADESIATVDENGVVRGIKEGSTTITVTTQDGGFAAHCAVTITAAQPPVQLYGMIGTESLYYSEGGGYYRKPCTWVNFNDVDPETSVFDFGGQFGDDGRGVAVAAAEYVDGYIYGFTGYGTRPEEFFKMSFEDFEYAVIEPEYYGVGFDNYMVLDMAYNYSNETMYYTAVDLNSYETILATVDLVTGESRMIGTITNADPIASFAAYFSIAISTDGTANALRIGSGAVNYGEAMLCELDLDTAEIIRNIGLTGAPAFQQQSMTYDHNTGVIYWAQWDSPYAPGNLLRVIDPATGESTPCGVINGDGGCEILGMFIPYDGEAPQPPQYELGDVNMDGTITVEDSLLTFRSAMNLFALTEEQQQLADINQNGIVNSDDALVILRLALGL